MKRIDNAGATGANVLHDEKHFGFGQADATARPRLNGSETMHKQRRAFAGCAIGIVAHVQTINIMRIVINQMFAVARVEIGGSLAHVDELIVLVIPIARPVMIFVDLNVRNCTAGVGRDTERIIELERGHQKILCCACRRRKPFY